MCLIVEKTEQEEKEKGKMIMHVENPHIREYQCGWVGIGHESNVSGSRVQPHTLVPLHGNVHLPLEKAVFSVLFSCKTVNLCIGQQQS
ncbi:hypothetical protein DPMN_106346 [Dreissena polymorpha]|uniref:Uncharacterized protein n=1 Tax=Dreissena polymorpha TaxID=45954 RepID=A0A9D4K507_DREPO|nr:hypothetical protein DPMN_106346 [Dreissena polymorpha]